MKFLLNTASLGKELLAGALGHERVPALASELGLAGVEWLDRLLPCWEAGFFRRLARAQEQAGAGQAVLGLSLDALRNLPRSQAINVFKTMLDACGWLGTPLARVALGGGGNQMGRALSRFRPATGQGPGPWPLSPGGRRLYRLLSQPLLVALARTRRRLPPRASHEKLQREGEFLGPLALAAQERGIKLAVENHWGITSYPEDLLALVRWLGLGNLGICLDTGNFFPGQSALAALGCFGDLVLHVHLKYRRPIRRERPERGLEVIKALETNGYRGCLGLEGEGAGGGLSALRQTAAFLNRSQAEARQIP